MSTVRCDRHERYFHKGNECPQCVADDMSAPDNPPAFPREDYQDDGAPGQRGMTLRDYFAAAAMMRMHAADKDGIMGPEITAQAAYRMADMMLAERAK